mmetsp:Transcript_34016/g.75413  ORF Transcript_34016/g.75413 Transcript_34016/m.75413 type:complete len:366 (+) Transcript_34016:194-1291(+)|eukprot:CAMPEP_0202897864 /NCGR_PEP_ID=MMETSP1392-20130828/6525_1 /ASSEMBLY_ACC=CAM_ASM_000868 /TAXON_ID=225041 /ORGANISM="Chlamydomonas chlamydogama, Strain SAG 11-48b" /LENGTH=365 /DNA_ID=CAMNT_0049583627 /DNA_START=175 /DNA_END=1272 /DNA_ORIENTATION=-
MATTLEEVLRRTSQLSVKARDELKQKLLDQGVALEQAVACSKLFASAQEALPYIGSVQDRATAYSTAWQEYYSIKYQRFYYCNKQTGDNSWDIPPQVLLREWMLDADLYRIDVTLARDTTMVLLRMMDGSWHRAEALWGAVELMSRVVGNVVQCGNSVEKYRHIRCDNAKFRDKVLALPGAMDVLRQAGFTQGREMVSFPPVCPDMGPATVMAAKLQQLHDRRGFTGSAIHHDDSASSGTAASTSRHAGKPGFRFQAEIFECSVCAHAINDGSERLFTKSHDAPKGEFRYECSTCPHFNLCEKCWDRMLGGENLHDPKHSFKTVHPKASQHYMYSTPTDSNPWGVFLAGGSASRARDRLRERTGL